VSNPGSFRAILAEWQRASSPLMRNEPPTRQELDHVRDAALGLVSRCSRLYAIATELANQRDPFGRRLLAFLDDCVDDPSARALVVDGDGLFGNMPLVWISPDPTGPQHHYLVLGIDDRVVSIIRNGVSQTLPISTLVDDGWHKSHDRHEWVPIS
jgi:hypothetical protein